MLFADHLVVVRGGGDLATGAAWRLRRAGFPVVVLELARPLVLRRRASFAAVVLEGDHVVEGVAARLAADPAAAAKAAHGGEVAVAVSPELPELSASILVDARLAKHNIDTRIDQAPLVVALGPGFTAGVDCHAVVETMRGPHLGKVFWDGAAAPDTGIPGTVGGESARRVLRAPDDGPVAWSVEIGDDVAAGDRLGEVGGREVLATISGVVRGLISPGHRAERGLKIGDIDPRADRAACFEISDKARAVGGGVLEAAFTWLDQEARG